MTTILEYHTALSRLTDCSIRVVYKSIINQICETHNYVLIPDYLFISLLSCCSSNKNSICPKCDKWLAICQSFPMKRTVSH